MSQTAKSRPLLFHYLKGWTLLLLLSLLFSVGANYFAEQSLVKHIKQSLINQAILFERQILERLEHESNWMAFLASDQETRTLIDQLSETYQQEEELSTSYQTVSTVAIVSCLPATKPKSYYYSTSRVS